MSKTVKDSNLLPSLDYLPVSAPSKTSTVEDQLKQNEIQTRGYIPMTESIQKEQSMKGFYEEVAEKKTKSMEKFTNMAKYNPFVPIGCLVTIGVLFNGLLAMKNKDRLKSQQMMKYRVAAQGATIVALIAGTFVTQFFYTPKD